MFYTPIVDSTDDGLCHDPVATKLKLPPVSGTWLAVYAGESVATGGVWGETPQHGSLYVTSHALVGIDVNAKVTNWRHRVYFALFAGITPSTDSADAGRMCWRWLVAHHVTSVFDEFNWNLSDFIQLATSLRQSRHYSAFLFGWTFSMGKHSGVLGQNNPETSKENICWQNTSLRQTASFEPLYV